jgi:tetratricopeptide (TPR) repeat protein/tRNA A-37 threonylcarbamoyl transferase component Bud32
VTRDSSPRVATDDTVGDSQIAQARTTARRTGAPTELERGDVVGRYVVLSRLGAGGMGIVYAAYDPELDRKVALKLLRSDVSESESASATGARTRLLREAQALAKLAHPNIVAVHDVGEHEGSVWLAMEYVDGTTLGSWLEQRRRSWREVVEVMSAAALGLAAAHAAGLVHRDFKPDNVMVATDGRVRVMDLGLARSVEKHVGDTSPDVETTQSAANLLLEVRVTQVGAVLGTPAYMSPEQIGGLEVDARTDVFSWCVTLWQALYGERPFSGKTLAQLAANVLEGKVQPPPRARRVPAWLRRVALRGLAVDPDRRFSSMEALLAAMARGRRQGSAVKWAAAVGAVAVLAGGLEAQRRYELQQRAQACVADGAAIEASWNDEVRGRVRDGLLKTHVTYAESTADRVMPYFDAQAEAWREARTEACLDTRVRGRWNEEMLDKSLWCLDERRMALEALAVELGRADETVVRKALTAASQLEPVQACRDELLLDRRPAPPEDREAVQTLRRTLSQAEALGLAGRHEEGLELLRTALTATDSLESPQPSLRFASAQSPSPPEAKLRAHARRVEATLLEKAGSYVEAEEASLDAYVEGLKVEAWDVAAAAAVDLISTVGYRQARHAEGRVWARQAEAVAVLAGDAESLREASRLSSLAIVHWASGAHSEAKALNERALAIRENALGSGHPSVASSLNNLAIVHYSTGEYAQAKTAYERALAIYEETLGPDHPDFANSLNNLAVVHEATGAYAEAKTLHERVLAIRENAFGPDHPDLAGSLNNLANLHQLTGAYAQAKTLHERALAIKVKARGPDHPDVAISLNNLAAVHWAMKAYGEAKTNYERALAIRETAFGPDHAEVAESLNNLASVYQITGAYAEAEALHARALAIREKALGRDHPDVADSLGDLGALALEQGRGAEAVDWLERAVAIYDAHEGVQESEALNHFLLAKALVAVGKDQDRALSLAHEAAAMYREAGEGMAKELAEVEKFLEEHGGGR